MSVEPSAPRKKKVLDMEIPGYQEPADKAPVFTFPLRNRFIQEGCGFKLICSVDAKPQPKVNLFSEFHKNDKDKF